MQTVRWGPKMHQSCCEADLIKGLILPLSPQGTRLLVIFKMTVWLILVPVALGASTAGVPHNVPPEWAMAFSLTLQGQSLQGWRRLLIFFLGQHGATDLNSVSHLSSSATR